MLGHDICRTARLARDPGYDGLFFIGVKTTGIYCRPVCPVKQPLEKNVTYYPTAAAAERAGFRPCLRCRPETAPFCPAWKGTRSTVERALKLIADGALDQGAIDELSGKLGVTSRHLSRLFEKHVGASPVQTAQTIRLQRAKRLLDSTGLPMADVAALAGFLSLRRFNDAFRSLYGRTPSKMRRHHAPRQLPPRLKERHEKDHLHA